MFLYRYDTTSLCFGVILNIDISLIRRIYFFMSLKNNDVKTEKFRILANLNFSDGNYDSLNKNRIALPVTSWQSVAAPSGRKHMPPQPVMSHRHTMQR